MAKQKGNAAVLDTPTVDEQKKKTIEEAAYYHWLNRGCPIGDDLNDWVEAEQAILQNKP